MHHSQSFELNQVTLDRDLPPMSAPGQYLPLTYPRRMVRYPAQGSRWCYAGQYSAKRPYRTVGYGCFGGVKDRLGLSACIKLSEPVVDAV